MEKPRTLTPLSEAALAQQIVSAYATHFGRSPDRETAELLLALIDIENSHGGSIIDFNWGNISTNPTGAADYWRPPWFDLDAINAMPDNVPDTGGFGAEKANDKKARYLRLHQQMLDHQVPSAFLAFPDHATGARVFLQNVKPSMYDAAATGDPEAFAHAYWSSGYCPDEACKNSGPTFQKLQAAIRAAGYFASLAPAKKKAPLTGAVETSPAAAAPLPSSPSPASASLSGSSSPPSGSSAANLRNLVVFAASCELEHVALFLVNHDQAGIAALIVKYWTDVLAHPAPPFPAAWCGALALTCLHEAGLALEVKWEIGKGFLYHLPVTHHPEPGDIAYLDKPWQHHAIVTDVEGDTVHTIDGNQGPSEPIKTHSAPLSHWTAFYSIAPFLAEVAA